MNKQTINNYTEKMKKGNKKGFIDESSTYKTLPEKDEWLELNNYDIICIIERINKQLKYLIDALYIINERLNKLENTRS